MHTWGTYRSMGSSTSEINCCPHVEHNRKIEKYELLNKGDIQMHKWEVYRSIWAPQQGRYMAVHMGNIQQYELLSKGGKYRT